ncbi:DUF924 domain-containing protein [Pacificimonas sp. WHA3]|uniref:DUF924 domain-containing protein n=1 Tax=Pacificimonas pallii TaxID=2827236 RepID=A0ABS6SGV3_9SPHN|nr:DUF924 family protein [Pacificimonas pallii]MBV7257620.1 DUF924 domain-containing protein [Pacificimonas pallii]
MPESALAPEDVLAFWFEEADRALWFGKDDDFDALIRQRFGDLHAELAKEVPGAWLGTREGVLAAIIVLDQFSRNLFRGDGRSYAQDADALSLANLAIDRGWDGTYADDEKQFLYMPFMHGEHIDIQNRAVELYDAAKLKQPAEFARKHRDVILEFGRFPGRNAALGRENSAPEQAYLDDGGGF